MALMTVDVALTVRNPFVGVRRLRLTPHGARLKRGGEDCGDAGCGDGVYNGTLGRGHGSILPMQCGVRPPGDGGGGGGGVQGGRRQMPRPTSRRERVSRLGYRW